MIRILIIIALAGSMTARAQDVPEELTESDIPSLVDLVDSELDLSADQERKFGKTLRMSLERFRAIQASDATDVEKLYRIRNSQAVADRELKDIFSPEQYRAYRFFVDGVYPDDPDGPGMTDGSAGPAGPFANRVRVLAADLDLEGDTRNQFTDILIALDSESRNILSGPATADQGIELLTRILAADIELIELFGKAKYEEFYRRRAAGALAETEGPVRSGDIETVLMFSDLAAALNLGNSQVRSVIRTLLLHEQELQRIRLDPDLSDARRQEMLRQSQQGLLMDLQESLSDEQIDLLLQLSGS